VSAEATREDRQRATPDSRRKPLAGLAVAWLVLLVAILVLNGKMTASGGSGILAFEFAGSHDSVARMSAQWGASGRAAAKWANIVDYGFLVVYGALLTIAISAVRGLASWRGLERVARLGTLLLPLPIVAAAVDAVQNTALLVALHGDGGDTAPRLAQISGIVTSTLLVVVLLYLVAGGAQNRRAGG
jgi:hypothetical protein